jgi:hypothetical protein
MRFFIMALLFISGCSFIARANRPCIKKEKVGERMVAVAHHRLAMVKCGSYVCYEKQNVIECTKYIPQQP